jgi:hypothetical protein
LNIEKFEPQESEAKMPLPKFRGPKVLEVEKRPAEFRPREHKTVLLDLDIPPWSCKR